MAVADATVVESAPVVMLDEVSEKNKKNDGGGNREEKGPKKSAIGQQSNIVDESDSTATITSTTSSLYTNSLSGFLINRRLQAKSQSPARMASFSKNFKQVARVSSRNLNISLARSKLYNSFPNLSRKENQVSQTYSVDDENVQKVLKAVESDHVVSTHGADNRNRRTVYIEKQSGNGRFGFTIQSYTIRHGKTNKTEQITYVDYVDLDGPAFVAGLRAGDIILAINGRNVQDESHQKLVKYIGQCSSLRMVVLFENCVNRIELCARAIKLKKLLADKEFELKMLCCQEERILSGLPPFTDVEVLALLRTPCNTPRSVSFSLPNTRESGAKTSTCPRRPSAPDSTPRSTNLYYVNEDDTTPRAYNSKRDSYSVSEQDDGIETDDTPGVVIEPCHLPEFDDRASPNKDWNTIKPNFVLGSEAGGSSAQSSSCRSSFRQSIASSMGEQNEESSSMCPSIGEQTINDDLALIHILHIDDTPNDGAKKREIFKEAITHF